MALKGPYRRLDIRHKIPAKNLQAQIGNKPTNSDVHRKRWDAINRVAFEGEREIWWIEGQTAQSLAWPNFGKTGVKQIVLKCSQNAIDNIKGWSRRSTHISNVVDNSKRDSITIMFDIQPVKFEATGKVITLGGKKISETAMTRMQEAGSAWVFKQSIKVGKTFNSPEAIRKDHETMKGLKQIWEREGVPDVGGDWIRNFYLQNKELLNRTTKGSFEEFNHTGGFMEWVGGFVKREFMIPKKDNWNPADIWLINNPTQHINDIERAIVGRKSGGSVKKGRWMIDARLDEFNTIMRRLFKTKQIWGISLKKVSGDEAKWEEVNVEDQFFEDMSVKKMTFDKFIIKFEQKTTKDERVTLASQDTRFIVKQGQNEYDFQIKSNTSTKEDNLKYEPTDKGATAARLGKATAAYVEALLDDYNVKFRKSNSNYPNTADKFREEGDKWKARLERIFKSKNKKYIETDLQGTDLVQQAYDNLMITFHEKNQPWVAQSKLMQIEWIDGVLGISDTGAKNKDSFATDMVFLAKKEGPRYGPFAKLY